MKIILSAVLLLLLLSFSNVVYARTNLVDSFMRENFDSFFSSSSYVYYMTGDTLNRINFETRARKTYDFDQGSRPREAPHNMVAVGEWVFVAKEEAIYRINHDFSEKSPVIDLSQYGKFAPQLFANGRTLYVVLSQDGGNRGLFTLGTVEFRHGNLTNLMYFDEEVFSIGPHVELITFGSDTITVYGDEWVYEYSGNGRVLHFAFIEAVDWRTQWPNMFRDIALNNRARFLETYIENRNIINRVVHENMSEADKVRALHDFLAVISIFDHASPNLRHDLWHTAYGVVINREAVCAGFANAFWMLLEMVGINSYVVIGNVTGFDNLLHAWNLINVEGQYFHIDVTWNLASENRGRVSLDYFLLSDRTVRQQRTWTEIWPRRSM
ncbi:MAG: hypothetical protein FWC91_13240 [Defluviitaleaceae bacterium]|nr:hypothetical protein [Defluviitaleaceae bacterium]